MTAFKDKQLRIWINDLTNAGQDLITKAFNQSDFNKNKTQNLRDSYGSAVYYNGNLVQGSKRFFTQRAVEAKWNPYDNELQYGRSEISQFFDEYKSLPNKLQLVIAVAMFYGSILEEGKGNLRHKYKVISGVADDIENLAKKYNGIVRKI